MYFPPKAICLKNGQSALFSAPDPRDAADMLAYLRCVAGETEFLLRAPEEWNITPDAVDAERVHLQSVLDSPLSLMIVCKMDGEIAGNCSLLMNNRYKTAHKASIGIALRQKYWNLGIGTAMLQELIAVALQQNLLLLELEFIEGNERARHLYEKMGFTIAAEKPMAVRFRDGSFHSEFYMIKCLSKS